ncbi:MAG: sugar phosphate nucleotidyltransferase [candidate division KSB1 bacterium]|nr:sugar phosphate nucleotidyltransferase [candidate division KSB1 bacterium]MDZ7301939.1 sugar phosphate nucleotidyltransferase [candidate division KSB1 bacterium]MDZ7312344.1 sugar phosphate nucleotidyltransferase [candidate division KSB1 bacterium]
MQKILAMILAGGRVDELSVLTQYRPKSAVPFGGLYRVIDFPMSSLMHSGIENVGILSQYRSYSLNNHIGNGAAWEMVGRNRSVSILPPYTAHKVWQWYRGSADAVYQNLDFIQMHRPQLVLVLSGDHIYSMDFNPLIEFHNENNADLTIGFLDVPKDQAMRFGIGRIEVTSSRRGGPLVEYLEKPQTPPDWPGDKVSASLTIYLFAPKVLFEVLENHARLAPKSHEFGKDIIPNMLKKYRVFGYKYDSYWGYTRTIDEYWQTSMDLLGDHPLIDPERWQVRTNLEHNHIRDRIPAVIGGSAEIKNSLIYSGCKILGTVENSILFPGVEVQSGAVVKDSILMFDTRVEAESHLNKVISDVDVVIGRACRIGFGEASVSNEDHPQLLQSGITLIGRGSVIPDECQIGCNCIIQPDMEAVLFLKKVYGSGVTIG